jgi:hypothetical protein
MYYIGNVLPMLAKIDLFSEQRVSAIDKIINAGISHRVIPIILIAYHPI